MEKRRVLSKAGLLLFVPLYVVIKCVRVPPVVVAVGAAVPDFVIFELAMETHSSI